jgi:acetylornithine deacetylase
MMTDVLSPRALMEKLIGFDTVSRNSNLPLIDWVLGYLTSHGIQAEKHVTEDGEKAGLWAHAGPWEPGGVVLNGHTDVVPVDGQAWVTDPFTVVEKDGKLYGRGTCDMKGFDALAIWAMVEAHTRGVSRPLQLALTWDEEVGCIGAAPLIASLADKFPRASDVIVGEPTMMETVTGHKGGVTYWVHVHGFEVHSSILHTGVSAVMEAAKLIDWANQMNAELGAATPQGMAAIFDPPYTNLHVGQISGGTAHNISAKDCEFGFGFRVVPGENPDDWRARFTAKVAEIEAGMKAIRPESSIEVREIFYLPPFAPTENNAAEALVRSLSGDNATHVVSYGSDASHFQAAGFATVLCGPGNIAMAHQPNEYITIAQFEEGQAFLNRLLDRLS